MDNHQAYIASLTIAHITEAFGGHLTSGNLTLEIETGNRFEWVTFVVVDVGVDLEIPKVLAEVVTSTGKKTRVWVGRDFTAKEAHRILKGLLDG